MSTKEKQSVLETFKNLPKDVQMAMIAGKALAETERTETKEEEK